MGITAFRRFLHTYIRIYLAPNAVKIRERRPPDHNISPALPALRHHHRRSQRVRRRRLGQTLRRRDPQRGLRHLHRRHRHRAAGHLRRPDHRSAPGLRHRSALRWLIANDSSYPPAAEQSDPACAHGLCSRSSSLYMGWVGGKSLPEPTRGYLCAGKQFPRARLPGPSSARAFSLIEEQAWPLSPSC